ncbi:MAG: pilin [Patescibacteria group bacterium]
MAYYKKVKYLVCCLVFIFLPTLVLAIAAPAPAGLLKKAGETAGYDTVGSSMGPSALVGRIIYSFLGLLGVIFLVLIVYAGYLWMTAGGEEQQIEKAKSYIKNSVIGLVIILAAFGITRFVIGGLLNATLPQP